jgi:hypothetical protein
MTSIEFIVQSKVGGGQEQAGCKKTHERTNRERERKENISNISQRFSFAGSKPDRLRGGRDTCTKSGLFPDDVSYFNLNIVQ